MLQQYALVSALSLTVGITAFQHTQEDVAKIFVGVSSQLQQVQAHIEKANKTK